MAKASPSKPSPAKAAKGAGKKKGSPLKRTPIKTRSAPRGKVVQGNVVASNDVSEEEEEEVFSTPMKESKVEQKLSASKPKKSSKLREELKKEEVVEQKISNEILNKATSEIVKFAKNNKSSDSNQLFEDENENLFATVQFKKFVSDKPNFKPKTIKLTNSIYNVEDLKICLFIKDDVIDENILEKIEAENIANLDKIITLKQLKKEYKQYEQKRKLVNEYDLFLTDDSILNTLPKTLGKVFYQSSKIPLPIRVNSSNNKESKVSVETIKNQIQKCVNSTFFLPPMGINISVKFGSTSSELEKLTQNLNDVINYFNFEDLRSIHLKSLTSPSIPIFITDKLYAEEDVLDEDKQDKKSEKSIGLSDFEKGLFELGDTETVTKLLGKKMKYVNKKEKTPKQKVAKKTVQPAKVTKPKKDARAIKAIKSKK